MTGFQGEVGRLNGIHAEPGTILGPDLSGQWYAVQGNDAEGCTVRFATTHDIEAAKQRKVAQSMAELGGLPK